MTDTTTYPLSTATSAALHSQATGPAHLTEDIVVALMQEGAIGGPTRGRT
jgi:hypothetical protein